MDGFLAQSTSFLDILRDFVAGVDGTPELQVSRAHTHITRAARLCRRTTAVAPRRVAPDKTSSLPQEMARRTPPHPPPAALLKHDNLCPAGRAAPRGRDDDNRRRARRPAGRGADRDTLWRTVTIT